MVRSNTFLVVRRPSTPSSSGATMEFQDRTQINRDGRNGGEFHARDGQVLVWGNQVRIDRAARLCRQLSLPHLSTSLRCAVCSGGRVSGCDVPLHPGRTHVLTFVLVGEAWLLCELRVASRAVVHPRIPLGRSRTGSGYPDRDTGSSRGLASGSAPHRHREQGAVASHQR